MIIGFDWASWYGVILAVAVGIGTIGGALALAFGGTKWLTQLIRPREPLVSFGHPSEDVMPWAWVLADDIWEERRQNEAYQRARLSSLRVSYLIENKGETAFRELSTGIRTRDGTAEHAFQQHFVQILALGETTEVAHVSVPEAMHEGMTDSDRALNFVYWARFIDSAGRRWEATYDPRPRSLTYQLLRRSVAPWKRGRGTDATVSTRAASE